MDPKSDIKATPSQASWLASILGLSGIVGFCILSPIMQVYGRKLVHFTIVFSMIIGWTLFYFSQSLTALFIARSIHGLAMGGVFINMIIIGEYSSPSRRGYFSICQKIALSSGALICHLMAIWFTWRQIAVGTAIVPIIGSLLTFLWPESPFFLAMKGRYDECERSFYWLNGTLSRREELEQLIREQKKIKEQQKVRANENFKMVKQLFRPDFLKSFLIVAFACIMVDLSGRNYFKAYVVQIMTELLGSRSIAVYISVGSDLSVLVALFLSCVAAKCFKRRHLLFSFGYVAIAILLIVSLILYLKSRNILVTWPWLAPGLILFVHFIMHIGVSPICFVIMGEIFPLELKGLGCFMIGIVFTGSYAVVLKLTPVLMESIGLAGTYLVYGTGMVVCLTTMYFILPETKDRPLLEIEHNMKGVQETAKVEAAEVLLKPVTA